MLCVISPAKRLNEGPALVDVPSSTPDFQGDAVSLANTARRLSAPKLQALMSISPALAKLNQARFRAFEAEPVAENTRQAGFMFAGDTYLGLEIATLDGDELEYAQSHLRILSGLYGLLRLCDQIQPYRLEMGSQLATRRGKTLYKYWGDRLSVALNAEAARTGAKALVNCASIEYFSAVDLKALEVPVVTPSFYEVKNGEAKIVSFFAKKARGAMARFVMQQRLRDPEGLADFDLGGYRYQPELSTLDAPVFHRAAVDQAVA